MKFKSIANPSTSEGRLPIGKKITVPDQTMSLEEILSRFTRGEAVAVGRDINYHESDDDLEKVSRMDLVDKEEYIDRLKQTQRTYQEQEKAKHVAERKKIADEVKAELKKEAKEAEKAD